MNGQGGWLEAGRLTGLPRRTSRQIGSMLAAVVVVAGSDLGLKIWATEALADGPVSLPGPLDLKLSRNSGVAFGLLDGIHPSVLIALTALVAVVLLGAWHRGATPLVPSAMIVGGAGANVLDRIDGGSVVDMFYTGWWPTFNLADVFIVTGVGLWLFTDLRNQYQAKEQTIKTATNAEMHGAETGKQR